MIKGIIFDLDGTLLNTLEDLGSSVNHALTMCGYPTHPLETYKNKIGGGFLSLMQNSCPQNTEMDDVQKSLKIFLKFYDSKYTNCTKPYDGVLQLLLELQEQGILLGINSNKRDDYTKKLVNLNFPKINFVSVIGQQEGLPKKPDPKGALLILEAMELKPEEVLYVGDSAVDIFTAHNANLLGVGVEWGFRGRMELLEAKADYLIVNPLDILLLIK